MLHRGWFRVHYLSLALILSCPTAQAGDFTLTMLKNTGTWVAEQTGNILKGAAVAAITYNAKDFNPDNGTFDFNARIADMGAMQESMNQRVMENRGIPTGAQGSSTYQTVSDREWNRLPESRKHEISLQVTQERSKTETIKELDYWIRLEDDLIKSTQEEIKYRTRKGQMDQVKNHQERLKQYQESKAVRETEKESRKVRKYALIRELSDRSLARLLRNVQDEIKDNELIAKTENAKYFWSKDEDKAYNAEYAAGQLRSKASQIEKEKAGRSKSKTSHRERVPEGGNGGGAPDPEDPDKDPKKIIGRGLGMTAVGEGVKEIAEEAIKNMGKKPHGEPHTPPHGEPHGAPHGETHATTHTNPKAEKSLADHKAHEQKIYDDTQKKLKAELKADRAQMNHNPQPFHEKGIEPHFPQDPGQRIHQINDRTGHFKEFTPNVEEAVRSTIKKEHFDYVENGNSRYTQEVKGIQVWVEVRPDGTIKNFGGNEFFHTKNPVTGKWDKPANLPKEGPGVILGLGIGAALSAGSESHAGESKGEDFKLSDATLQMLGIKPEVQERIKNDPNPLKLPDAPKDSFINNVSVSPEMKAIVEKRLEYIKSLPAQEQVKEMMKPMLSSSGPKISLPTGTSTSSKSGQTALPMLTSTTTRSTPSPTQVIAQRKASSSSSRSASRPSAPPSSRSSYSAPKSSSSSSGYRPSAPSSGYGSRGGGPPPSFGKRN